VREHRDGIVVLADALEPVALVELDRARVVWSTLSEIAP